jgi:nucleoside-diphosphate-sugar epimerase
VKRALVTGATGLLGGYVVERLVAEGWTVRGLVRDPSQRAGVDARGGEAVSGDVTDLAALRAAAAGCAGIVHAAAAIGAGGDGPAFQRVNVSGTENVLRAAEAAGSRVVHVSTTAVFGRQRYFAAPTDESAPLPALPADDGYGRSKQDAERVVRAAHAAGRVWATLVRPPMMYGRGDRQFVPRVAPLLRAGVFPLVAGGRNTLALVHAQAVADGAVRALGSDLAGGRCYHLTDDFPVTVADLVRGAAAGLGRRIHTPSVSAATARRLFAALAAVLEAVGRRDLAFHARGVFEMVTRDNPFTSARARRELGWSPTLHPADGLADAFAAWRDERRAVRPGARGPARAWPSSAPGS